jgi:chromosomal replication initiator protein
MTSPPMFWNDVVRRLEAENPPFVIEAWVHPLIVEANDDRIRLLCPSALHRDRIRDRFLRQIRQLTAAEAGRPIEIEVDLIAPTQKAQSSAAASPKTPPAPTQAVTTNADSAKPVRQTPPSPARLGPRKVSKPEQRSLPYTFENFVVGACNRLAREASFAVAQGTQQTVNPLYLASAPGLGKTHLARAIAQARVQTDGRVIYTSSEAFTNQFTGAIRNRKMDQFKKRYRSSCDLLVVEDVQLLGGRKATQFELFQTMSHLVGIGARVVLTSDRLPNQIAGLDERVSSHMTAGLVATLDSPDALVRREILRVKAASGGVRLPMECLDLLVDVVRGSVRDLEGVLVQLVTTSSLLKRPIDLELTEEALAKVSALRVAKRRLDLATIIEVVAKLYETTQAALASRSRRKDAAVPRQIAMYLCRRYTQQPASAIARAFARSHPSVANAEKVVERRMLESAPFRYRVEAIAARLDELEREPQPS